MNVAIIGGGAAGFFAAIATKENYPNANVIIFEKTAKVLSKVKVSGGGRCNVTNAATSIKELAAAYPRGANKLKKAFGHFSNKDTIAWFEKRQVPLLTQDDNCVFPVSQDSQSIIDCFLYEVQRLKINIKYKTTIIALEIKENQQLKLIFKANKTIVFDKVIIATGGSPKLKGLDWLAQLGHQIVTPVPSLFTFNMPNETITKLMGIVVNTTQVSIQGTKLQASGPLLITHWGMSGPAILKLSAFAARLLSEQNYNFKIQVNWVNEKNTELIKKELQKIINTHPKKLITNYKPYGLTTRFWEYIITKLAFPKELIWADLGKKRSNQLVNILSNDVYQVQGKTTFKEEFVTCGGVSLDNIDFKTMQSKVVKNLYFAGEVMDIDGITGGYNFQAAWTTGFIAGKLLD
jgi:predicted Rossmann fold flavoprotein